MPKGKRTEGTFPSFHVSGPVIFLRVIKKWSAANHDYFVAQKDG